MGIEPKPAVVLTSARTNCLSLLRSAPASSQYRRST
ncbi:MAG: hypothetical protein EOR84_15820 [Mesorhizobium sp.]|nr:MAG: hypothetical protein EOR84_15820 [Mesorhizobium sp.]